MARPVKTTTRMGVAVQDGPDREDMGRQRTQISGSTTETTIVTAGGAGIFNDISSLRIANTSVTATNVELRDDTAGSIVETWAVPAGQTVGFHGSADGALKQAVANKNWTLKCTTGVAAIEVTAHFVKRTG